MQGAENDFCSHRAREGDLGPLEVMFDNIVARDVDDPEPALPPAVAAGYQVGPGRGYRPPNRPERGNGVER